jgi:hypothetical protein
MASDGFVIKFDGGDADYHSVDMRLLGESLQGIERIASDLIVAVLNNRLPKKGERAPFIVKAYEPSAGSVTIPVSIQEGAALLQLGWQIFGSSASDIFSNWFKAVLLFHSDRKSEAEQAMEHVANLAEAHNEALRQVEANRHDEVLGMQAIFQSLVERLGPAATQAVAPVGPSVRRLWFLPTKDSKSPQLEIDTKDAERIRKKENYNGATCNRLPYKQMDTSFTITDSPLRIHISLASLVRKLKIQSLRSKITLMPSQALGRR